MLRNRSAPAATSNVQRRSPSGSVPFIEDNSDIILNDNYDHIELGNADIGEDEDEDDDDDVFAFTESTCAFG